MKCQYCGNEVAGGQKFCIFCGTRLEEMQEKAIPVAVKEEIAVAESEPWGGNWLDELDELAREPVPAPVMQVPQERKTFEALAVPALQLPTKRGLGKMIFLGLLTLGIYPTVIWSRIVTELNLAASRYDGKRTVSYFGAGMLAGITLGIYAWVWMHNFSNRVGDELRRRNIGYSFGAKTFWLWGVLGSLILVGPFIYTHKLMQSMNRINEDFNVRG